MIVKCTEDEMNHELIYPMFTLVLLTFAIGVITWLFVGARVAHAWIHIGSNKIFPRIGAFMLGFFCVFALWVCVMVRVCCPA
jgi:hypothetical protein